MTEWIRVELEKVCSKVGSNYQPKESSNLPYVGLEHIESEKSILTNHGFESEIKSSKTMFKKGQILYGKLRPYLDKAVIAPFDGICSTDILVFDSNTESMNEFLIHLIHSQEFIDYAKATTNGVQHPRTSWNSLRQFDFLLPSLPEQRKIAHVLSKVQKAIEQQDKLISTTTELKKALMQKLFTEGTRGEPQRETEIGLVPESWGVASIRDMYTFTKKPRGLNIQKPVPFIPMELVPLSEMKIKNYELRDKGSSGTYVENGDLLLAKITPSFENGKQGFVSIAKPYAYATTEVIPIKDIENLSDKFYLFYYLLKDYIRNQLTDKIEGSTGRQRLSKTILEETLIPKPSLNEQKEIADLFISFDKKNSFCNKKKQTLTALFKTLLHELMTGQRRVHELEF